MDRVAASPGMKAAHGRQELHDRQPEADAPSHAVTGVDGCAALVEAHAGADNGVQVLEAVVPTVFGATTG
jgi:hypothetical protein